MVKKRDIKIILEFVIIIKRGWSQRRCPPSRPPARRVSRIRIFVEYGVPRLIVVVHFTPTRRLLWIRDEAANFIIQGSVFRILDIFYIVEESLAQVPCRWAYHLQTMRESYALVSFAKAFYRSFSLEWVNVGLTSFEGV